MDALTGKSIYNDRAWVKAKNTLKDILMGNDRNPPNIKMCMQQLNTHGDLKKDWL